MNQEELKIEAAIELKKILSYWANNTIDNRNGGFIGQIDFNDQQQWEADKGSVLHARILWTFSAAVNLHYNDLHAQVAETAFTYIRDYLIDPIHGGVYWTVSYKGEPRHDKKQVYAQAFTIYALAEYYKFSKDDEALSMAVVLFELIEHYALDKVNGGYVEAFSRTWGELEDLRLSDKDANEKKTMNTHLHIVEGYANLHSVAPNDVLRAAIIRLLHLFQEKMIDKNGHLKLFFTETWEDRSKEISFGHDIEASWLLLACAEIIPDEGMISIYKNLATMIVDAASSGLNSDHSLNYEYIKQSHQLIDERHWWVQAEAVVGFVNAWSLSGEDRYLQMAKQTWNYIRGEMIDDEHGEWYWGRYADGALIQKDKVGVWKCPYHNGRACLELIKRL